MSRPMKDSGVEWIGEIPEDWNNKKIFNMFKIIGSGTTPKTSYTEFYDNGTISWLNTGDLNNGYIIETKNKITEMALDNVSALKIYPKDSLVVAMYGATIGKLGITKIAVATNQACCVLAEPKDADLKFVFYWLMGNQKEIVALGYGGGQPNISQQLIKNLRIPCPDVLKQQKIAIFLDEKTAQIDAIINNTKQSIIEFKKYKQALITETVTKGLNPDVQMKESGIEWFGDIPEHWGVSKLGKIYDVILGKMLSPEQKADDWTYEQYICAANVHFEGVDTSTLKSMWFSPNEKENWEVKFGDLLIVEGGAGAGGSALYSSSEKNIFVQNSINIVRSRSEKGNTNYAYYLMHSLVKNGYIDFISSKATFAHFTKEKVKSVPYPVVPIREQQEIVTFLNEKCAHIDSLIADKEKLISEFEDYKKALIYEYVTGKKEVE